MKKQLVIFIGLLTAIPVFGQHEKSAGAACDCPSCTAAASGKKAPYTLPGLQDLNEPPPPTNPVEGAGVDLDGHEDCDHDQDAHAEHDYVEEESGHDDHTGHDHGVEETGDDAHAGHDHGDEAAGMELAEGMAEKVGIKIHEAEGGTVAKSVVFPAEIKLNRDRAAAVSPRYASIVRQVFAEIGDQVRKGDILASLENRETMAVYTVAAPLDGAIVSKALAVGETAGEDEVLFEVADLSSVWVDISIFPQYRHHVQKGQRVMLTASDGHSAETTIKYISPLVSTETRTLQARCVLKGAGEDFTPGAFVRAAVTVEAAEVEVRVEKAAVQTVEGRPVVFIADDHGFEARDVVLGVSDRTFVEIKAGLEHGEHYVAKGAFELKAEMVTSGLDPHAGHGH